MFFCRKINVKGLGRRMSNKQHRWTVCNGLQVTQMMHSLWPRRLKMILMESGNLARRDYFSEGNISVCFLERRWRSCGQRETSKPAKRREGERWQSGKQPVSVLLPENIHLKTLNALISETAEFLPFKIPPRLSRIVIRFLGGNQLPCNHCLCQWQKQQQ